MMPKLQDYNFILQHIPDKTNTRADILLRKYQVDTKEYNKDIEMLKNYIIGRNTEGQYQRARSTK